MGQAIEQRGRHFRIAENASPFAEAQVGGDDHAGSLVELAEQVEKQGSTRGAERQVPEFIQDHEVMADQALGDLARASMSLFLLQRVDEIDGGEEPDLLSMMFDGLDGERGRDMGFSRAWSANQDDIVSPVDELAAMQLPRESFVDLAGGKIERGQILVGWKARRRAGDVGRAPWRQLHPASRAAAFIWRPAG